MSVMARSTAILERDHVGLYFLSVYNSLTVLAELCCPCTPDSLLPYLEGVSYDAKFRTFGKFFSSVLLGSRGLSQYIENHQNYSDASSSLISYAVVIQLS